MVAQEESLVTGVDDHRVAGQPSRVEIRQHPPNVVVDGLHGSQIILHVPLILPPRQRFAPERHGLPVHNGRDRVRLDREPLCEVSASQAGRRFDLEIAVGQVVCDSLLIFVQRIGPRVVAIPEGHRLRDTLTREVRCVLVVRLPRTVRGLVMYHQKKRLVTRPGLQKIQRTIRNHVSRVAPRVRLLAGRGIEDRIEIDALPGKNFPPIEADRIAA